MTTQSILSQEIYKNRHHSNLIYKKYQILSHNLDCMFYVMFPLMICITVIALNRE